MNHFGWGVNDWDNEKEGTCLRELCLSPHHILLEVLNVFFFVGGRWLHVSQHILDSLKAVPLMVDSRRALLLQDQVLRKLLKVCIVQFLQVLRKKRMEFNMYKNSRVVHKITYQSWDHFIPVSWSLYCRRIFTHHVFVRELSPVGKSRAEGRVDCRCRWPRHLMTVIKRCRILQLYWWVLNCYYAFQK